MLIKLYNLVRFVNNTNMAKRFFIYGLCGLIMETCWTAFVPIFSMNYSLYGRTSLWMLPVYGMVVLLEPMFEIFKDCNFIIRGGIYCIFIFIGEFFSGAILRYMGVCPWNYSNAVYNIQGLIRLDYAPLWFVAGLLFEKISTVYFVKNGLKGELSLN